MTEHRVLVNDLNAKQHEGLSDLARMTGRDEQELLDNLPQIIDVMIEAFEPVKQSIIQMGTSILKAWNSEGMKFYAEVEMIVAAEQAKQGERR